MKLASDFMHISSNNSSLVWLFGNEEKPVELLVYSSFRQVATSGFQNHSVATRSSRSIKQAVLEQGVNTESLRNQHSSAAR